jgi:hypothetical protein
MRLTAFGGGNRFVAKSDTKIRRARWFHKNGSFPAGIVGDEAQARCSGAALGITLTATSMCWPPDARMTPSMGATSA